MDLYEEELELEFFNGTASDALGSDGISILPRTLTPAFKELLRSVHHAHTTSVNDLQAISRTDGLEIHQRYDGILKGTGTLTTDSASSISPCCIGGSLDAFQVVGFPCDEPGEYIARCLGLLYRRSDKGSDAGKIKVSPYYGRQNGVIFCTLKPGPLKYDHQVVIGHTDSGYCHIHFSLVREFHSILQSDGVFQIFDKPLDATSPKKKRKSGARRMSAMEDNDHDVESESDSDSSVSVDGIDEEEVDVLEYEWETNLPSISCFAFVTAINKLCLQVEGAANLIGVNSYSAGPPLFYVRLEHTCPPSEKLIPPLRILDTLVLQTGLIVFGLIGKDGTVSLKYVRDQGGSDTCFVSSITRGADEGTDQFRSHVNLGKFEESLLRERSDASTRLVNVKLDDAASSCSVVVVSVREYKVPEEVRSGSRWWTTRSPVLYGTRVDLVEQWSLRANFYQRYLDGLMLEPSDETADAIRGPKNLQPVFSRAMVNRLLLGRAEALKTRIFDCVVDESLQPQLQELNQKVTQLSNWLSTQELFKSDEDEDTFEEMFGEFDTWVLRFRDFFRSGPKTTSISLLSETHDLLLEFQEKLAILKGKLFNFGRGMGSKEHRMRWTRGFLTTSEAQRDLLEVELTLANIIGSAEQATDLLDAEPSAADIAELAGTYTEVFNSFALETELRVLMLPPLAGSLFDEPDFNYGNYETRRYLARLNYAAIIAALRADGMAEKLNNRSINLCTLTQDDPHFQACFEASKERSTSTQQQSASKIPCPCEPVETEIIEGALSNLTVKRVLRGFDKSSVKVVATDENMERVLVDATSHFSRSNSGGKHDDDSGQDSEPSEELRSEAEGSASIDARSPFDVERGWSEGALDSSGTPLFSRGMHDDDSGQDCEPSEELRSSGLSEPRPSIQFQVGAVSFKVNPARQNVEYSLDTSSLLPLNLCFAIPSVKTSESAAWRISLGKFDRGCDSHLSDCGSPQICNLTDQSDSSTTSCAVIMFNAGDCPRPCHAEKKSRKDYDIMVSHLQRVVGTRGELLDKFDFNCLWLKEGVAMLKLKREDAYDPKKLAQGWCHFSDICTAEKLFRRIHSRALMLRGVVEKHKTTCRDENLLKPLEAVMATLERVSAESDEAMDAKYDDDDILAFSEEFDEVFQSFFSPSTEQSDGTSAPDDEARSIQIIDAFSAASEERLANLQALLPGLRAKDAASDADDKWERAFLIAESLQHTLFETEVEFRRLHGDKVSALPAFELAAHDVAELAKKYTTILNVFASGGEDILMIIPVTGPVVDIEGNLERYLTRRHLAKLNYSALHMALLSDGLFDRLKGKRIHFCLSAQDLPHYRKAESGDSTHQGLDLLARIRAAKTVEELTNICNLDPNGADTLLNLILRSKGEGCIVALDIAFDFLMERDGKFVIGLVHPKSRIARKLDKVSRDLHNDYDDDDEDFYEDDDDGILEKCSILPVFGMMQQIAQGQVAVELGVLDDAISAKPNSRKDKTDTSTAGSARVCASCIFKLIPHNIL